MEQLLVMEAPPLTLQTHYTQRLEFGQQLQALVEVQGQQLMELHLHGVLLVCYMGVLVEGVWRQELPHQQMEEI
jgi:hypothetical protein